jgi:hypothetical protein
MNQNKCEQGGFYLLVHSFAQTCQYRAAAWLLWASRPILASSPLVVWGVCNPLLGCLAQKQLHPCHASWCLIGTRRGRDLAFQPQLTLERWLNTEIPTIKTV